MKLRNGFVSNSSSASYVVVIGKSKEDFLNDMIDGLEYGPFYISNVIHTVESQLENLLKVKDDKFFQHSIKNTKSLLTKLKKLKNACNPETVETLLKKYYRVDVNDLKTKIRLTGFTSMHNSFSDVPDVLKDIITYYTFTSPQVILAAEWQDES